MRVRVAVAGAGISGLACARVLVDHGVEVTVFDKGRSVGGRVGTHRIPPHAFDLGAQYFTASDPRFAERARAWCAAGVCAPWVARIMETSGVGDAPRATTALERFVGLPSMSSLPRHMAAGLHVRSSVRVERILRDGDGVALSGSTAPGGVTLPPAAAHDAAAEPPLGAYDAVILCMPSRQAADLCEPMSPALAEAARAVVLEPCFAVGFVSDDDSIASLRALPFDGLFVGRHDAPAASPLSWVARDSSKPGRPPGERFVLHASAAWSRTWMEAPQAEVKEVLLAELAKLCDLPPLRPALAVVRRWAFANGLHALDLGAQFDESARIGIGGDWACGGRIEGAFLSGVALAERALAALRVSAR